jgi:hypothetical protein
LRIVLPVCAGVCRETLAKPLIFQASFWGAFLAGGRTLGDGLAAIPLLSFNNFRF